MANVPIEIVVNPSLPRRSKMTLRDTIASIMAENGIPMLSTRLGPLDKYEVKHGKLTGTFNHHDWNITFRWEP